MIEETPDYSPDGKKIAYTGADGNDEEINTINATGGKPSKSPTTRTGRPDIPPGGVVRSGSGRDSCTRTTEYAEENGVGI
jgi:hypothetical protein